MRPGETLAGRPDELRRALREQAGLDIVTATDHPLAPGDSSRLGPA